MKSFFLNTFIGFVITTGSLVAQDFDKNIVKLNLTALPLNNFEVQYERALTKKISITLSGRYQPYGSLPALSTIESIIDDPEITAEIENLRFGNTVLTSEFRFYLGKKPGPRGFYIAPFARLSNIKAGVNEFELETEDEFSGQNSNNNTIDFNGDIKGLTGGLMFGSQWRLGKMIYLDWWIIGASFGNSSGEIAAATALTIEEQDYIRTELSDLEIPFVEYTLDVDNSGARFNFNGPFATLRAGISLGIRF